MEILRWFRNSKILSHADAPGLMTAIEELAQASGARMPKVRLTTVGIPNAAFHPHSNTLFITDGLFHLMEHGPGYHNAAKLADVQELIRKPPSAEIRAILAHEMGHVRFKRTQLTPIVSVMIGLPAVGMAAMYLLEESYKRVKQSKASDPQNPEHFWTAFKQVSHEKTHHGWESFKDFLAYAAPVDAKLMGYGRYKDETWGKTLLHEGRNLATQALLLVPAFAACRPLALRNEWQSDRFMLALTQDKEACLSAFQKLSGYTQSMLAERAKNPVQRSFAQKIAQVLKQFMQNTIMAHPELHDRIDFIRHSNPAELAKSFRL